MSPVLGVGSNAEDVSRLGRIREDEDPLSSMGPADI
jgi:hypothetical protein